MDSAIAQPAATFGGNYLHSFPFEMSAAYLFHLVGHHPFVDGNKRIGAVSALVFLDLNGYVTEAEPGELYELTIAAARGETNKHEIAEWFRKHSRQIDDDSGVDCRSDSL